MDNDQQLEALKQHLDDKFTAHEKFDELIQRRSDEIFKRLTDQQEAHKGSISKAHTRVDRMETQMKTIKGIGTAIATALGAAAAWLGMHK